MVPLVPSFKSLGGHFYCAASSRLQRGEFREGAGNAGLAPTSATPRRMCLWQADPVFMPSNRPSPLAAFKLFSLEYRATQYSHTFESLCVSSARKGDIKTLPGAVGTSEWAPGQPPTPSRSASGMQWGVALSARCWRRFVATFDNRLVHGKDIKVTCVDVETVSSYGCLYPSAWGCLRVVCWEQPRFWL